MKKAFGFLIPFLFSAECLAGTPSVNHVVQVVFENGNVQDARKAPFFQKLANEGVEFTRSFGVAHPSQPNYIAMIAGSTLGVVLDNQVNLDARHLGDLLEEKGLSWKVYAEDYPGNCFLGMTKRKYARKHVPFLSFKNVQSSASRCDRIQNSDSFFQDVKNHTLPSFSLWVPNLDHDGHDTNVRFASQWFSDQFGGLLQDQSLMKDTLFVITFDDPAVDGGEARLARARVAEEEAVEGDLYFFHIECLGPLVCRRFHRELMFV